MLGHFTISFPMFVVFVLRHAGVGLVSSSFPSTSLYSSQTDTVKPNWWACCPFCTARVFHADEVYLRRDRALNLAGGDRDEPTVASHVAEGRSDILPNPLPLSRIIVVVS